MSKQLDAVIAQKDQALKELSHVEDQYNNLFNENQTVKSELAESGKNLYEAKNLLDMCRSEKTELRDLLDTGKVLLSEARKDVRRIKADRDTIKTENQKLIIDYNKKHNENNELINRIDQHECLPEGNTYWPFHKAGDESFVCIAVCLMLSVCAVCLTVYKIAQMIGF